MNVDCALVSMTKIDFNRFLPLANNIIGYSPVTAADKSPIEKSDQEKFLWCLSGLEDPTCKTVRSPHLLNHLSYGLFVAGHEDELLKVIELCGMPVVAAATIKSGINCAVISGTLLQWRAAVESGLRSDMRDFFERVKTILNINGVDQQVLLK